jgi:hypothetical protein
MACPEEQLQGRMYADTAFPQNARRQCGSTLNKLKFDLRHNKAAAACGTQSRTYRGQCWVTTNRREPLGTRLKQTCKKTKTRQKLQSTSNSFFALAAALSDRLLSNQGSQGASRTVIDAHFFITLPKDTPDWKFVPMVSSTASDRRS